MDELRQLTLSQDGFSGQISTLDEIIKLAKGKIKLNIEVKLHGGEKRVSKVLKRLKIMNLRNNVSFKRYITRLLKSLSVQIQI